eukprot:TRINITY_DN6386_c2_g1_i2.p1 TRINITY_DN6386_c2_g1~~TRINITY_DN6386_c2_g1_i2.p1  ORF type:complete len:587 (+),score=81.39 TRINITY_DN6386_c2_g1_i2:85-1845(+)
MADGVLRLLDQVRSAHLAETLELHREIKDLKAQISACGDHGRGDSVLELHKEIEHLKSQLSACGAQGRGGSALELHKEMEDLKSQLSACDDQGRGDSVLDMIQTTDHTTAVKTSSETSDVAPEESRRFSFNSNDSFDLPFALPVSSAKRSLKYAKAGAMERRRLFINGPVFETFFACMIFVNALIMAFEVQHASFCTAAALKRKDCGSQDFRDIWPGADTAFLILDWIFGILFTLEIVLKMYGSKLRFTYDVWNWIDSAIVCIWIFGRMQSFALPINGQVFRLFRLVRLLRLVRLARTIQTFDSLYLITTALKGSISILAWAVILLFLIQMMLALLLTQLLTEYYFLDETVDVVKRHEVYLYFGSFTRSFVTMMEITLANWPPVCRLLMENVSEWFALFSMIHKMAIGFATVGVLNGVFMQETFKVASEDDRVMLRQKERSIRSHVKKMRKLFKAVDHEGRGYISFDQFKVVVADPHVKTWLASMELSTADVAKLYALLDDGDERLLVEELVEGVAKLKGPARSFDLAILMQEHHRLLELVSKTFAKEPGGGEVLAPKRALDQETPPEGPKLRRSFFGSPKLAWDP